MTTTAPELAPLCTTNPAQRARQFALLPQALRQSWSAATSADENWTPSNPSLGQCAVTALIVQDFAGGTLARTTVHGVSHYYNILPGSVELDLTRDQFPAWEPGEVIERDRDYVLSFQPTADRYAKLKMQVYTNLGRLLAQAGRDI